MNGDSAQLFWTFAIFVIMLFISGFYCILVTRNLVRMLVGLEILTKAATLIFIVVGYITNQRSLAEALVITTIVVEVAVIVVASGIIMSIYRHQESLDVKNIRNMKG